ncbi:hypothetical protein E0Z10_g223 [Xylaria hypoxylon]|uniref:C3H1-type domain-containing protein n=1 Tax=Xylaria hypoxylon TaxID=37992 RepID=A0A4Z0ZAC3_9PEZI|nr:hypothetical protein E0Z10_g223 [Xylaria hypoxylon]
MERLGHALVALALVIPALAAPGPMLTRLSQQPMGNLAEPLESTSTTTTTYDLFDPTLTLSTNPPATAIVISSPVDLRKKRHINKHNPIDNHKSSDNGCTPGDRACYHTLDSVLFCNEDRQWVNYAQCQSGTFCHRLHMVCVAEVLDPASQSHAHELRGDNSDHPKCKEGDRRCNTNFNRVDRCNGESDWVTYHDCRTSEFCEEGILECLPKISSDPKAKLPGGTARFNGTGNAANTV